ncbi:hypothetical protein B0H13DRAFT_1913479 [Mycena leptocephala]|nr:hypothetical protein B0H13DRAFT_1913479 [Mycena leptocephala]
MAVEEGAASYRWVPRSPPLVVTLRMARLKGQGGSYTRAQAFGGGQKKELSCTLPRSTQCIEVIMEVVCKSCGILSVAYLISEVERPEISAPVRMRAFPTKYCPYNAERTPPYWI